MPSAAGRCTCCSSAAVSRHTHSSAAAGRAREVIASWPSVPAQSGLSVARHYWSTSAIEELERDRPANPGLTQSQREVWLNHSLSVLSVEQPVSSLRPRQCPVLDRCAFRQAHVPVSLLLISRSRALEVHVPVQSRLTTACNQLQSCTPRVLNQLQSCTPRVLNQLQSCTPRVLNFEVDVPCMQDEVAQRRHDGH
jgi:hypothetical protein